MIDFGKILKNSLNYLWKYKFLWLLGILIGGSNINLGGSNFNYIFDGKNIEKLKQIQSEVPSQLSADIVQAEVKTVGQVLGESVSGYIYNLTFWLIIAGILLVLILLAVYLKITATGAIIGAIDKIDSDKSINLGASWRIGHKYFWRVLSFGLILFLLIVVPLTLLSIPVVVLAIYEVIFGAIGLGMLFLLIYVIYSIYLSIVMPYAQRIMILENKPVVGSIKEGVKFFNKNWKNITLMYLILIGISIGASIVIVISLVLLVIIALAFGVGAFFINKIAGAVVGLFFIFLVVVLMIILGGVISAYQSSCLTLTYRELKK